MARGRARRAPVGLEALRGGGELKLVAEEGGGGEVDLGVGLAGGEAGVRVGELAVEDAEWRLSGRERGLARCDELGAQRRAGRAGRLSEEGRGRD